MTRLLHYSLEQWDDLIAAPWLAALAVMDGDPSGMVGTGKEQLAAQIRIKTAAAAGSEYTELVFRVAEELRDLHKLQPPASLGEIGWHVALDRLGHVVEILELMASDKDSHGFRMWLFEIATEVAEAAKEGIAGLGARVSHAEHALLAELKSELRLQ